jgi:hypothetical protein
VWCPQVTQMVSGVEAQHVGHTQRVGNPDWQ